jgi:CheY-like chemotaxis protein
VGEADRADVAAAGIQHVLTKPVRQSQLLNTLSSILGVQVTGGVAIPARATLPTAARAVEPGGGNGPRILVAEDASINQLVARRMLERLGCHVDVASNGHEVLDALELIPYALVLMDVQMPEMDGFEATAEIRKREALTGQHTPIVAITANAMKGDRERAIAAGMDDYLAKPIRLGDLELVLLQWASPTLPASEAVIGADVEDWLAEVYLADEPQMRGELRTALQSGDAKAVSFAAHKLKGSAAAVNATALVSLCAQLEHYSQAGSFVGIDALVERLESASAAVRAALEQISSRRADR